MQNNRINTRRDWNRPCQLYWNGSPYSATVKNLSVMVMGVQFDSSLPGIKIGDECVVQIGDDHNTHTYAFNSQVFRVETSEIALRVTGKYKQS